MTHPNPATQVGNANWGTLTLSDGTHITTIDLGSTFGTGTLTLTQAGFHLACDGQSGHSIMLT